MNSVFGALSFKYEWRDYQKKILDRLETHLIDRKLHIVAAPGSGKTVLGLEVMRRLAKPTLILTPSITIRNQWIERLVSMFTTSTQHPTWVSKDVRNPKTLTVITYQSLHSAMKGMPLSDEQTDFDEEEGNDDDKADDLPGDGAIAADEIFGALRSAGIETVILDEAHHLRKEWWKVLNTTMRFLENATIVSLTATPPYDVSPSEWKNYYGLCGSIDEEISIPELVKVGDLCPHQDYIYFSRPASHEEDQLKSFQSNVEGLVRELTSNKLFGEILLTHRWFVSPEENIEGILEDPSLFSLGAIFLQHMGFKVPITWLRILGLKQKDMPVLNLAIVEKLLEEVLYVHAKEFSDPTKYLDELKRQLQRMGAVDRKNITIKDPKKLKKTLSNSITKLESVVRIAQIEKEALGKELRMVILADYIRKSHLPKGPDDINDITELGIIPIFESLRRAEMMSTDFSIGVLTGSMVIIPNSARKIINQIAKEQGINLNSMNFMPLAHDERFLCLTIASGQKQNATLLITECFMRGSIQIMVGTTALLGEGWDAPALNSLIIASYVGSYMLSNQMRGRAIRTNAKDTKKVSNVWHLATVNLHRSQNIFEWLSLGYSEEHVERYLRGENLPYGSTATPLGEDVESLKRRLLMFEAPSFFDPSYIENGIQRFGLGQIKWDKDESIENINSMMKASAVDRNEVAVRWNQSLIGKSSKPTIVEKIKLFKAPGVFLNGKTIAALFTQSIAAASFVFEVFGNAAVRSRDPMVIYVVIGMATTLALPISIKAMWLILKNGSLENNIQQVGRVLVETLHELSIIKTNVNLLQVKTEKLSNGFVTCSLEGSETFERTAFIDAMEEIFAPIENPKYMIVRKSRLIFYNRTDYHNVPEAISRNKAGAEAYLKKWRRMVGDGDLLYTRSPAGRAILLKARIHSMATAFQQPCDRLKSWE